MNQNPFSFYDFLGYLIPVVFIPINVFLWFDIRSRYCYWLKWIAQRSKSNLWHFELRFNSYYILYSWTFYFYHVSIFIEKYMNKELGYPSKYLFKKLIDTSETFDSPSCDERSADKKTKIKNRIIKCVLCPIILWDFYNKKTMLFSISTISFS